MYCLQERLARVEREVVEEENRAKHDAEMKKHQIENAERRRHGPVDDSQVVDEVFGFINDAAQTDSSGEGTAPAGFKDLEESRRQAMLQGYEGDELQRPMVPEDTEDISQYKFPKFAATYFQGNASHTYIRRVLKAPLLALKNEGDQLVSIEHVIHNFCW